MNVGAKEWLVAPSQLCVCVCVCVCVRARLFHNYLSLKFDNIF